MGLKERLKEKRLENNMTLEELAKKVGVSRQTIQRYESGIISNIPSDKIELMSTALNTTPSYLMGWEDNLTPETASLQVKLLMDSELLKCVNDLINMNDDKRKRVYGYVDSLKEQ